MKKIMYYLEKYGIAPILLLAGYLNIFKLWDLGYGNTYYAAAIKSMLSSFSNFFFISFDSTSFISVDKAPLSLWVDTLFAKILGFSGFTILLPHALEGIVVTLLVYLIVKKVCGNIPALAASLVITLSPVNVAVYRNNTPDALLLVFVLLTVLFFIQYFESKKLKFLLISALMLGLGFNTKMLQSYLILPALLPAILIFAPGKFIQRIKPAVLFTIVLAIVSFSWITIVDLTPANMRPFVGGSENNSAWNLAIGYNGVQRFEGESGIGGNSGFNVGNKGILRLFTGEMGTQSAWFLLSALLFSGYFLIFNAKDMCKKFLERKKTISTYHVLMFLGITYLATQYVFFSFASFFHSYYLNIFALPIALTMGGLVYEIIKTQKREETIHHTGEEIEAGSKGKSFWKSKVLLGIVVVSALIQISLIYQAEYATYLVPIIVFLIVIALLALTFVKMRKISDVAGVVLIGTLLITPFVWSNYTTVSANTATAIFIGGPSVRNSMGNDDHGGPGGRGMPGGYWPDGRGTQPNTRDNFPTRNNQMQLPPDDNQIGQRDGQGGGAFGKQNVDADLLTYLKENYSNEKYFVAVSSSQEASGFILDENIGNIMNLGGFSGRDQTISLVGLQEKIKNGEIRFFYLNSDRGGPGGNQDNSFYDGSMGMDGQNTTRSNIQNQDRGGQGGGMFNANAEVSTWVTTTCTSVDAISGLYDCKAEK